MSGAIIAQDVAEDVMADAIVEQPIDGSASGFGLALMALSGTVSLTVLYWLTETLITSTPFSY